MIVDDKLRHRIWFKQTLQALVFIIIVIIIKITALYFLKGFAAVKYWLGSIFIGYLLMWIAISVGSYFRIMKKEL